MKRFLLLFILATSLIVVEANVVTVSKEDALAVVKQQMDNNPFDYYVASLTSLYDDGEGSCIIDSIPDIEWLKSSEGKWLLVFPTAELPQGQYLVSLIINNNVVETLHATKR